MTIYMDRPDEYVDRIIKAAYPDYAGRKISIEVVARDTMFTLRSYWDGGCRDYWTFVSLADMRIMQVSQNGSVFDKQAHQSSIPPGVALIQRAYSGSRQRVVIHIGSEDAALCLPAPAQISHNQAIVLSATRSFKPCYAGQSNYRFSQAHRQTGISREQWDGAKGECQEQGWLNKAGAITATGRNAIQGHEIKMY